MTLRKWKHLHAPRAMRHALCAARYAPLIAGIAGLAFLFVVLVSSPVFAADTVVMKKMRVPGVHVVRIEPSYHSENRLLLTAGLNFEQAYDDPGITIEWEIVGDAQGYTLEAGDSRGTAVLVLGDLQARVVVRACLSNGHAVGGCKELALENHLIQGVFDDDAWSRIEPQEWDDAICMAKEDDALQYVFYKVSSRVNTVTGMYLRESVDLRVPVPGGELQVTRNYENNRWVFGHTRDNLAFEYSEKGELVSIRKNDVVYSPPRAQQQLFVNDTYRILKRHSGFRWEDKYGRWKEYENSGQIIAFGDRNGLIGQYLYKQGRLASMADRDGKDVLRFGYDPFGNLDLVWDDHQRSVSYLHRGGLLRAVTGIGGQKTLFEYDRQKRLSLVVEAGGQRTLLSYHNDGKIQSVLDENGSGNRFAFHYDRGENLYYVKTEATSGFVREVWFTEKGQARRVDINGRTVKKIAAKDNVLTVTDGGGHETVKVFDDRRNLLEVVYPDGSKETFEYEKRFNRKTRAVNANGFVTKYDYDDSGNLIRQVESVGTAVERVREYGYDGLGNRTEDRVNGDLVERMEYDGTGNRIALIDAAGNKTSFSYDAAGNLVSRTDPLGNVRRWEYDLAGNLIKSIDPLGNTIEETYDNAGRRVAQTDAAGGVTRYRYDRQGRLVEIIDAEGGVTLLAYDPEGKIIRETDPEGSVRGYAYDNQGRLAKTIDGGGNETVFVYGDQAVGSCSSCGSNPDLPVEILLPAFARRLEYDVRGRKTAAIDVAADGTHLVTRFAYDATGSLLSVTDRNGNTTRYADDPLGRLKTVTDAAGGKTVYAYDALDNLVALADANGNATRFVYDHGGRLLTETRPMGQASGYRYDRAGNLIEKIDALGQRVMYRYDPAGRLIRLDYFEAGENGGAAKTVDLEYDLSGNLVQYRDGDTSAEYRYDRLSRKTIEQVDYGLFQAESSYTYYKNGLKKTYTGPEGITYEYQYTPGNLLQRVTLPNVGDIAVDRYRWNRPESVSYPGKTKREYEYDGFMRIDRITSTGPDGSILLKYAYEYDSLGNIVHKTSEQGAYRYGYDKLNRLVSANNPNLPDEAFTYDPVGNRLTSDDTAGPWKYNANNELLGYGDTAFSYDANGSTVKQAENNALTQFFYNTDNRLTRVEKASGSLKTEYYYDPFGRRLWKEVNGKRTYFFYAEEGLAAEFDQSGRQVRSYGYSPGSVWTTDPLFIKQGTDYYFYQNDHLGTPQKMVDEKGKVVWSTNYASFGKAAVEVDTVVNNLRFPGQYMDSESDLHYNYHRSYSPMMGRYLNADPIGFRGGNNLYIFVLNNPVKFFDQLGLFQYYERWGGPDWTAGQVASWDTLPNSVRNDIQRQIKNGWDTWSPYQPKDAQDKCYMYHDICFGEARMECRKQKSCYEDCEFTKLRKCDLELCKCLSDKNFSGTDYQEAQRIAATLYFSGGQPTLEGLKRSHRIFSEETPNSVRLIVEGLLKLPDKIMNQ